MSLLDIILGKKRTSANIAKERLQIILAHERININTVDSNPDWLPKLQQELVDVVAKYINISKEDLKVNLERKNNMELLEINVTFLEKDKTLEKMN